MPRRHARYHALRTVLLALLSAALLGCGTAQRLAQSNPADPFLAGPSNPGPSFAAAPADPFAAPPSTATTAVPGTARISDAGTVPPTFAQTELVPADEPNPFAAHPSTQPSPTVTPAAHWTHETAATPSPSVSQAAFVVDVTPPTNSPAPTGWRRTQHNHTVSKPPQNNQN